MLNKLYNILKESTYFASELHINDDQTGALIVYNQWTMYGFFVGKHYGQLQLSVSTVSRMQKDPVNAVKKNIAIRCADINMHTIKGTNLDVALRKVVKAFDTPWEQVRPFDLGNMCIIEDALFKISEDYFELPAVSGSTLDKFFVVGNGASIISLTYKRNHIPILYTHIPDFKNILRENIWNKMIAVMHIRFHGYENHPPYVHAVNILHANWQKRQLEFCAASGCVVEETYERQTPNIPTAQFYVRNPRSRPINENMVEVCRRSLLV